VLYLSVGILQRTSVTIMVAGIGKKTIINSIVGFAIASVFWVLIAKFTGFDLIAMVKGL